MKIGVEQEQDSRWIAAVSQIPGGLACGESKEATISKVEALILRILA